MFIINLSYKVDLTLVDTHLNKHIEYLETYYQKGVFQASGRKEPRTGGIILATCSSKDDLISIINKDPFKIHDLADYEIIEFTPSKTSELYKALLSL